MANYAGFDFGDNNYYNNLGTCLTFNGNILDGPAYSMGTNFGPVVSIGWRAVRGNRGRLDDGPGRRPAGGPARRAGIGVRRAARRVGRSSSGRLLPPRSGGQKSPVRPDAATAARG